MSNHQPQGAANGPPSAGMGMQQAGQVQQNPPGQNLSQANLNQIVIEYLVKKGYNRTEQMLRQESSNVDKEGRSIHDRAEDFGNGKYSRGLKLLTNWIDSNLDIYKAELNRLLWPVFLYSYLEMVVNGFSVDAEAYYAEQSPRFEKLHAEQLRLFETIKIPQQVFDNETTKLYRKERYRLPLNTHVYFNLLTFLESNSRVGGTVILYLLQTYCEVRETARGPIDQYSFEAIINQAKGIGADDCDLQEGIPGAFTGVSNKDIMDNNALLKLGPLAMEGDLAADVRAELEDEDVKNPPESGKPSLIDEFDRSIKREDSADGPTRNEIPLPPSRARDVVVEVQKIKENRDRFKIESRTGGVGPGVSVCMFTFHNTLDTITCIEFSDDTNLVAVGTEESYIRVWHLHGDALPSVVQGGPNDPPSSSSRRLIGHSAPVYNVSFSPSIAGPENADPKVTPSTAPRLLLSSSSDKTIRLWSLEAWTCLVVYKGHEGPAWNVRWGPFGHYFATCGWDKTVRVWGQDHISYLRMLVGHDSNVSQIAWHPNGAYIFSASDGVDRTVRMWAFTTGDCVRVFSGHTDFITALECSPNGKILASADGGGSIILWDLARGTMIKRCRGHGKGGIWSLSFSVESTVLVSGGADGTVRIWDIEVPADPYKNGEGDIIGTGGQNDATRLNGTTSGTQANAATGVTTKKKGKDTTITPDQISAFPTKKSPVYKVKFTRMNLVMAGGCYLPESFDNIFLDLSEQAGKCRFAENGFGWKPSGGGDTFTLDHSNIGGAQWSRASKGYEVKILLRNSGVVQLDGFQQEDFDRISKIFRNWYSTNLEHREHALRGWNWGKGEFGKAELAFNVQNRPAFEIPYSEITNTNLAGKNEVAIEFSVPANADDTGTNGALGGARGKGKKSGAGKDQLVEMRFYIPGVTTKREAMEGEDANSDADGEEEQNAASLFYDTLMDKAEIGEVAGDTFATFLDVLHLTPRGRFDIDMYETSFRLRGKTYDYKIQYESVKKFMTLPKPDDLHMMICIGLDPPLRQGQTRYPFLVMQFKTDEEVTIDLNMTEEVLKEKYDGKLQARYEQPLHSVVTHIFRGLAGKKLNQPAKDFESHHQQLGIKCSIKASEGFLYCLEKAFMFVPKPATYISYDQISGITFSRVGGAVSASRTFDVSVHTKSGGVVHQFSNINREEQRPLETFFKLKGLRVKNEMDDDSSALIAAALRDPDMASSDDEVVAARADRGSADEDDESIDEDFQGDSDSDVAEEFDSAHESSGSGSEEEAGSDAEAERPKKKAKTG